MNYNLFRFVEHLDYNEFVAFSAKMLNKFNYKDISYEKKYVNIDGVSYTVSNDGKKYIVSVVQSQVPIDETIIQRMEMRKIYYEADSSIIISSAEFTEEALNLAEIMKSKCYGKHYVESFLSDFNSDCIGFINYLSNEKIIKQDYSPAEIIRMYNELKIGSTKIPQFDSLKFTVPNFSDIFIKFWNNWYDFLFFMNEPSDLVMLNEKNISADQILGIDLTFKPKPKVRKVEVHVPKQEVRAEDSDDFIEEKRNLIKMKPKLPPPPPAPPVMQSIQPVSTKEPTSQQPLTNDTFYVKNKKKNRFSKPEYTAKPGDLVSKPPDPQRIQDRSMSMDINQMPAFASGKQPVKLEKKKLNVSAPSRTGIAAPDINREDKPILAKHEKYKQLHKQAEVEVAKEAPKVTHKVHHVEKAPEIKVAEVKATEVKIAVEKIAEAKVPKEKIAKTRKPKPIKYTNEDLIAAYFVVKENLGRKPTVAQMIQHGSFSFTTYVNRWGSYNKFLVSINEAEPEKIETKEVIKPISKEDKAELILDTVLESKAVKKAEPIIREISAIEPPVKANKQEIIAQKQEIVETLESGTFELQIEMVQEEPAPVVEAPAQLTYEQIVSLRESNEVPDSENHVSVADAIDMIDKIYPIEHSSSGVIVKGLTPITSVPEPISDIYISTPKIAEESFIIRDIDMIVSVPITEINETTAEAAGMQPCENEIIIEVAAEPEQEMQVQEAIIQPEETAIIEMEVVPEVIASPEPEQEMQVQEATAQPEETAIIEIEVVPEVIASPEPEQEMQVQEAIAQPDEIAIIEIEVVPEVIASLEPEQEMQVQEAIAQPDETAIIEIELVPEVIASLEPEQEMQVQEAIAQPDETAIIEIELVPEVIASLEPEQEMQLEEMISQLDETAIIEIEVVPEVIASPEPEQEMQVQEAIAQPDETAIIEIEVVPEVIASPEPEQEMQVQEAIAQPDETAIIEIEVVPEVLAAPEPEQKINEIDSQSNNQVSETVESLEIGIDADPSDSTEMNIVSDFSENIPVNDEYHIEPEQVLVSEEIISIVETEINKGNISETNDIMPANAADEHNDTDQVILIESTSEAENIIQTVDDSAYSSNIENESIQIAEQFLVSESPSVTEEHTNVKRYNLSVDILIQECSRIQNSLGKFVILGNEFNENSEYTYSDFDYLFASNHALTAFAASIGLII